MNKPLKNLKNFMGALAKNIYLKLAYNVSRLCEGKGLEALNFKLSTND